MSYSTISFSLLQGASQSIGPQDLDLANIQCGVLITMSGLEGWYKIAFFFEIE